MPTVVDINRLAADNPRLNDGPARLIHAGPADSYKIPSLPQSNGHVTAIAVKTSKPIPLNAPMRARTCVVMPALDEQVTVGDVVRETLQRLGYPIIVVNDASVDQTAQRAREAGATVITLPARLGAWGASQTGIRWALKHGYHEVITMDADGQHDPEAIESLVKARREKKADVVIGTYPERLSAAKRVAWFYIRQLTRLGVTDFTSGLRVYGHRAIKILARGEATLIDYQDVGVLLVLRAQGASIIEVPAPMNERASGHSKVFSSWLVVARYMLRTTVLCLARVGHGRKR